MIDVKINEPLPMEQWHFMCPECIVDLVPRGRNILHMTDGGIIECIIRSCPKCRWVKMEEASVYSCYIPPYSE